jgi:hypothetical protein
MASFDTFKLNEDWEDSPVRLLVNGSGCTKHKNQRIPRI